MRWGVRLELGDWAGPVVLAFTTGNGQVRREEAFPVAVQLTHEPVARDDVAAGAQAISVPMLSDSPINVLLYSSLPRRLRSDFEKIYESSFLERERTPVDDLLQSVRVGTRRLYVAEANDAVVRFGISISLASVSYVLLKYLAIGESRRKDGFGSRLLQEIVRHERARSEGIILEVESPDVSDPRVKDVNRRRIAFYERSGSRLLSCIAAFAAPSTIDDDVISMKLMWIPLSPDATEPRGRVLRSCVVQLLIQSYGCTQDSNRIETNLASLQC